MQGLTVYAPFLGVLGLIIAYLVFGYVKRQPNGSLLMQEVEDMIHEGAMAFLTTSVITRNGGLTRCCTERKVRPYMAKISRYLRFPAF